MVSSSDIHGVPKDRGGFDARKEERVKIGCRKSTGIVPDDVKDSRMEEEGENGETTSRAARKRRTEKKCKPSLQSSSSTNAHKCIAISGCIFTGGTTERKERVIGTPT